MPRKRGWVGTPREAGVGIVWTRCGFKTASGAQKPATGEHVRWCAAFLRQWKTPVDGVGQPVNRGGMRGPGAPPLGYSSTALGGLVD